MLIAFIALSLVYGLAFYWVTMNNGDLGAAILAIGLPFVGMYYLGWKALPICLMAAYFGTKLALVRKRRRESIRVAFYDEPDDTAK